MWAIKFARSSGYKSKCKDEFEFECVCGSAYLFQAGKGHLGARDICLGLFQILRRKKVTEYTNKQTKVG